MKKKQAIYTIAVLLVLAVCLAGCTGNAEKPDDATQMIVPSATAELEAGTTPTAYVANLEPQHFVETINEHFHIDAEVVGYPADGMAAVYSGERCILRDNIQNFVGLNGGHIGSSKEWDDGSLQYYNGECDNGYRFGYTWELEGVSNTPYAEFSYFNREYDKKYNEYPIYYSEEGYETNAQYTVGWMFTEPKDFAFASAQEAEENTRRALETLGLSQLVLLRTLYIDHQTLEKVGQLVTTDDTYAPVGDPVENNGFTLWDDWSEADDAYMFSFSISVNGTPMSYRNDDRDTGIYCGSNVVVWYNEKGIIHLSVSTPWIVGVEEAPPSPIVPAQTALDAAKEKYQYALGYSDIAIEKIQFEYQHVQDRDRRLLMPVWTVTVVGAYEWGSVDYNYVYVDALTGREI